MTDGTIFKEFTPGQRQTYQAAAELYQALLAARRQHRAFAGGMHWKQIGGRQYLYRYRDRYGHGQSLGPRSDATERLFSDFDRERREVEARRQETRLKLQEQARFCRAALIHRVPGAVAGILRRLEQHELGQNLLVIGAAALYAYEFAAGVFLSGSGGDLRQEGRRRLTLASSGDLSRDDLLGLLRRTDRSFVPLPGEGCRMVNRHGFEVRVLKSGEHRPGRQRAVTVPGAREPLPPEAGQLQYLLASPRFSRVVIGADGLPATLVVPDPWALALNRLWWSIQPEREAAQRDRDRFLALAVAELVLRYLPQYDFSPSELEMFPRDLVRRAEGLAEESSEENLREF